MAKGNPNHDAKGKFAHSNVMQADLNSKFAAAKSHKEKLEKVMNEASALLQKFPKTGPMGMIPDNVKAMPEFKQANAAFKEAFSKLQDFNSKYTKVFKKQILEERKSKGR